MGYIIALGEGTTTVTIRTEDGDITKEIQVTVVPRLQEDEIIFDSSLNVNQSEISGIDINTNTIEHMKQMIQTKYIIEIYDYNGQKLADDDLFGTGCKIRLIDENNIIKMEYEVVVYGDVNGDGKINSVDLLVLQRHILEIEKLKGVFLKAGNINKNGKNPSSLDSLLIQRHILGLKMIEQ